MSYTPTQWVTGDTVTAERLNKMEQGIAEASEVYVINLNADENGYYLDSNDARDLFIDILPQYGKPMCFAQTPSESIFPVSIEYFSFDGVSSVDHIEVWYTAQKKIIFNIADIPNTGNFYGEINTGVFTVTLTPTAQDYSGTMDKTPSEIATAINHGDKIKFSIPSMSASADATQYRGSSIASANITYNVGGQDMLIQIVTSASDATYSTTIFPLTPMS